MRTNILISRIARLVETAGNAGDGAAMAEEYAAAMKVEDEEGKTRRR